MDYDSDRGNWYEKSKLGGIECKGAKRLQRDECKKQTKTPSGSKNTKSDLEAQFAKPSTKSKPKVDVFGKKKPPPRKKLFKK